MPSPSWPLRTERLVLRPFAADDLGSLHAIHSDEGVARWLYNDPRSLAETRELLVKKVGGASVRGEGEWLSAAAVLRETGELVADVALLWTSEAHQQGELGFIVHPAHQGRGYATEASGPLLAFAFETLGLHRVVGRLEPRNNGSARVLEKLGMRREAHLVENEWVKGEWQSDSSTRSSPASGMTPPLAATAATADTDSLAHDGGSRHGTFIRRHRPARPARVTARRADEARRGQRLRDRVDL